MLNFREQFLSPKNFQLAWELVATKNGCAGVDRETVAHFAKNSEAYLSQMRRSLASGDYHPLPLRQLFIPKKNGEWRELGVPTVRDRIVQHALLNILHPLLEPQIKTEDRRSKSEEKIRGRKGKNEQITTIPRRSSSFSFFPLPPFSL
jgi:retron-type reverse transcriptase